MKQNLLCNLDWKRRHIIFAFLMVAALPALGIIIPADRQIDWSNAGVPGGIPNRTTIYTTLSPGATLAQINTAIANCPSNQVVFLNAGTYSINGTIQMKSWVTLRGAGTSSTILSNAMIAINNPNYSYPYKSPTVTDWTSGYTQGTSSIVLSNTSGLQVGQILGFYQLNGGITVGANICGSCDPVLDGNHSLQQYTLVTGINGNTVTISPGLYAPLWSGSLSPKAYFWPKTYTIMFAGVEDLRINGTPSSQIIDIDCAYACWAKNVYCYQGGPFVIRIWGTKNIEIRHCTVDTLTTPSTSSNYGLELRWSSDFLIEDNIITTVPNNKWEGISGGVFAYNYGTNFVYTPANWLGETLMLHGGFPNYNLWEGNYFPNWLADNLKGAGGYNTLFRNRLTGWEPGKTGGTYAIAIYPDEYYINIVGNVLGTLGFHTAYQNQSSGGEIYSITATDPVALNSFLRHGNYDTVTKGIVWSTNTDHTIPNSLFRSSKPSYFGDRPWPPFDPNSPSTAVSTNIPAGYRFFFGTDPSGGTAPPLPPPPTGLRVVP